MVTGLSGVQFSLYSYERLTKLRESDFFFFYHEDDYRPKFCYQLTITLTKFVIYKALLVNQNTRNSKILLLAVKKKII